MIIYFHLKMRPGLIREDYFQFYFKMNYQFLSDENSFLYC